jgi:hypothetical protein
MGFGIIDYENPNKIKLMHEILGTTEDSKIEKISVSLNYVFEKNNFIKFNYVA